ncbi:cytochrome-c peroxidase [Lewinella sp. JB7]|uniref:cytochrome-c peroxidase n=1 Tax=Lewinella sp. JB7 TaxID=2962887 RepID=UPI0020C9AAE4|nr:cytochrome c peroxidase [Lewinella sp. JB7]MCP9236614.1 hypothetical protein [Lewinella sp. JB7]
MMRCAASFLVIVVLFLGSAATPEPTASTHLIVRDYARFVEHAQRLSELVEAYRRGQSDTTAVRQAVHATRKAYKRTAWLVETYYPTYTATHFNGPPLPRPRKQEGHSEMVAPEGLQVMDEMAYTTDPDPTQLSVLSRKLLARARLLLPEVSQRTYPLTEVLEAMRAEVVRIPTLYLTGFDTPGSASGLAESRAALASLADVLSEQSILAAYPTHAEAVHQLRAAAAALSAPETFAEFDRLSFQRNHLNGLYRILGRLQGQSGQTPRLPFSSGRNPAGQDLYADEFLDPYAYAELRSEDDSPALRALGKRLFYDERLSGGGQLSCGSCHQPERYFTDGKRRSVRDAPTLLNAVYADRYFYDLRAFSLEQQAAHVIYDHAEFATDYAGIIARLRSEGGYRRQFREAFGKGGKIDRRTFGAALASYVLSLRSFNSPFDRYARGQSDELDEAAKQGFNLFMGRAGCGTCHFAPTFAGLLPPAYTESESEVLGVPADPDAAVLTLAPDRGRAAGGPAYEEIAWYEHSVKTPTIRNVAETAPYFHHGMFPDLAAVVDFYDRGGGAGLGLTVPNQTLPATPLNLTATEKNALIAFMRSLTDSGPEGTR